MLTDPEYTPKVGQTIRHVFAKKLDDCEEISIDELMYMLSEPKEEPVNRITLEHLVDKHDKDRNGKMSCKGTKRVNTFL